MKLTRLSLSLATAACLLLGGCNYDAPATAAPTRPIEEKLLGDWVTVDPDDQQELALHVRQLDPSTYAVAVDGDIYRAFHSDFAGLALLSVQDLNSSSRKYLFYTWRLSADGNQLILRTVSFRVIPDMAKDTAALQRLLKEHAAEPKLLSEDLVFTRKPTARH